MIEDFKSVGCVALKDGKGNYSVVVPIYVNVKDVNMGAIDKSEKEITDCVSALLLKTFERQIKDFLSKTKETKNATAK